MRHHPPTLMNIVTVIASDSVEGTFGRRRETALQSPRKIDGAVFRCTPCAWKCRRITKRADRLRAPPWVLAFGSTTNLRTHSSCPRSHRRLYTLRCGMLWPKAKLSTHRLAHCADGPNAGRAAPGAKACECFLAVRHWAGHACSDDLYFSDLSAKEFRTDTKAGTSTCSYTSTWMNIMKSSFGILNTEAMSLKRTGSAKVKAGRSS